MNSQLYNVLTESLSRFIKNGTVAFVVFLVACSYVNDYAMKNDYRYVIFWGFVSVVSCALSTFQQISTRRREGLLKRLQLMRKTLDNYQLLSGGSIKKMLDALSYIMERPHSPNRWMLALLIAGSVLLALGILTFYLSIAGMALELTLPFCLLGLGSLLIAGTLIGALFLKEPDLQEVADEVVTLQRLVDQETNNALSKGVATINTLLQQGQQD